ncbi:cytochrome P450 [Glycomyces halotolerans]
MTEATHRPGWTAAPSRASLSESLQVAGRVVVPTLAAGVIKRRPLAMALAERFQVDRSAIRLLQRLRAKHGPGPLVLRVGGRTVALPLSGGDVARLLEDTPDLFTTDTLEKHAALSKFQPHGLLLSRGEDRERRRRYSEAVLDEPRPLHRLAGDMLAPILQECDELTEAADRRGSLTWRDFERTWWRIVRRVVFGDEARDDRELIGLLDSLRRSGNWLFLSRRRARTREALHARLRRHIADAGDGTLGSALAEAAHGPRDRPEDQVAHWLFAFDAAGITLPRTLALLAVHRRHRLAAQLELASSGEEGPEELPYLRACVLETLRLWPTTPLLLRDGTAETDWGGATLPAGTGFMIYTPLFHRDGERLDYADEFRPEVWTDGTAQEEPSLVPFSGGAARCPARNLVLYCLSTALARILRGREYRLASDGPLYSSRPVPATLDPFGLEFVPAPSGP